MAQDVALTEEKPAVHPVDQLLPVPKLAVYGFQHVLAFYAGAVIVPILLGSAIKLTPEQLGYLINADLFTCGIASIIQTIGFWKIGVRLPLLQGVTFAAVSPMISIGLAEGGGVPGLKAIFGAVIIAGIVTFVVAPFFANLIRLFPPIVTGTVITIIGVVLLSVAALDAGGGGASQFTEPPTFGALRNLALAGFTLVFILALYRFFKGFVADDRRPDRARRRHDRRGDLRLHRLQPGGGCALVRRDHAVPLRSTDLQRCSHHRNGHRHADHHGRDHW